MEQLFLVMIAMLGCSCLVPDNFDYFDLPLRGSYLVDLDTHFRGRAFAMIRVLSTFGSKYKELVKFLITVLDREVSLLHNLAGLSDQLKFED